MLLTSAMPIVAAPILLTFGLTPILLLIITTLTEVADITAVVDTMVEAAIMAVVGITEVAGMAADMEAGTANFSIDMPTL